MKHVCQISGLLLTLSMCPLDFVGIVRADLVMNGGFETPAQAVGNFQTIAPGGEPSSFKWSVLSGDVDISFFQTPSSFSHPSQEIKDSI